MMEQVSMKGFIWVAVQFLDILWVVLFIQHDPICLTIYTGLITLTVLYTLIILMVQTILATSRILSMRVVRIMGVVRMTGVMRLQQEVR